MGSVRKTMAAMLSIIALAAFMSDAAAQTRRSSSDTNRSSSQTRSSSQSSQTRRPSSASQTRKSDDNKKVTRPSENKNVFRPGNQDKPMQVTRPAPGRPAKPADKPSDRPGVRPDNGPDKRPGNKPVDRPGVKPGNGPDRHSMRPDHRPEPPKPRPNDRKGHRYGHKVRILPSRAHVHVWHGVKYYCYDDVWYRPYGGYYVVCRPPYGISLAADVITDMAWATVRLAYYNTVLNTYSQINENNAYIAEQNAIIAQNNATIATQNASIAQTQQLAQKAYTLANELGLVQSYASAASDYFYQDGIFYSKDTKGEYVVIIPPAGAVVESLPEDFETVTLRDGNEYYRVDDTIYKVTILEGKPYFEVIGQQYN